MRTFTVAGGTSWRHNLDQLFYGQLFYDHTFYNQMFYWDSYSFLNLGLYIMLWKEITELFPVKLSIAPFDGSKPHLKPQKKEKKGFFKTKQ